MPEVVRFQDFRISLSAIPSAILSAVAFMSAILSAKALATAEALAEAEAKEEAFATAEALSILHSAFSTLHFLAFSL